MTIPHQDDWDRMTPDQQLEALRHAQFGQEVWIRLLIRAVEQLGVTFTLGGEDADTDHPTPWRRTPCQRRPASALPTTPRTR